MPTTITDFTNTLTRIKAGGTGEEVLNKLNTPLAQIENHLNTLASRIYDMRNSSTLIRNSVPLAADVNEGDLVYFNSDIGHSRFEKAQAITNATPNANGSTVEAPCARVEGMVIRIDREDGNTNNVHGTLLLGGYYEDGSLSVIANCLGVSYTTPGIYYLSPVNAGKAVLDVGSNLRQPVLSNYGQGRFCLHPFYLAHDNHFHASHVLGQCWEPITNAPSGAVPPSSALWWYNGSIDPGFSDLGTLSSTTTVLFYNGLLVKAQDGFHIADGQLWCDLQSMPGSGTVTLFNFMPFAYGSPVVRSITSTNELLTVRNVNGDVVLTPQDYTAAGTLVKGVAVSDISGNKVAYTPVITDVTAGPGTAVYKDNKGAVVVSASSSVGSLLDAYSINHNQTNLTSDGTFMYVTFPKGRMSSITMTLPVNDVKEGNRMAVKIWCCGVGSTGSFTTSYIWTPVADEGVAVDLVGSASHATGSLSFSAQSGKAVYAEDTSLFEFTGNGFITANLAINDMPQSDVRMLRVGFKLEVIGQTADTVVKSSESTVDAVVYSAPCLRNVTKFKAVKPTSSGLAVCYSSVAADADKCVGIAIENAITGQDGVYSVNYILQGIIQSSTFAFEAGKALWLNTDGSITATNTANVSGAAFVQRIGTALSSHTIQINIDKAYIKE